MSVQIYSAFCPPSAQNEPKCPKTIKDYRLNHETGKLEEKGEKPFYDIIQSHADSCKLSNILKRAQLGDYSALNARPGNYLDISDAPSSLIEVFSRGEQARNKFDKLPSEIKELFGSDYGVFATAIADGSFTDIIKKHFTSSAGAPTTAGNATEPGSSENS